MKFHSLKDGKALCGSEKGIGYRHLKDFKFAMKWDLCCKKCVKILIDNKKLTPNGTTSKHS